MFKVGGLASYFLKRYRSVVTSMRKISFAVSPAARCVANSTRLKVSEKSLYKMIIFLTEISGDIFFSIVIRSRKAVISKGGFPIDSRCTVEKDGTLL